MKKNNWENSNKFFNRELSWLEFNKRVLEEAKDPKRAVLSRLNFLAIVSSNFDEFFMVRVAGLRELQAQGFTHSQSPDNMNLEELLQEINKGTQNIINEQYRILSSSILPLLKEYNIEIKPYKSLAHKQKKNLDIYFNEVVYPTLTPISVGPKHPTFFLSNLSHYIVVEFRDDERKNLHQRLPLGFVEIPHVLPRIFPLHLQEEDNNCFILLEDLVEQKLSQLFLGLEILSYTSIRVTRNLDYMVSESSRNTLLQSVQEIVEKREEQEAVRLEAYDNISSSVREELKRILKVGDLDIYTVTVPINIPALTDLIKLPILSLQEQKVEPYFPSDFRNKDDIFSQIRKKDLLVHHPYESFKSVTQFIYAASEDPDVLAIKQTLYRFDGDSQLFQCLIQAALAGKHVTVLVELKARFDEHNNIIWAKKLEQSGVNVIYGFVGLKTHCKTCIIVRKEKDKVVRYVHIATGNYNAETAQLYTDLSLFTSNQEIAQDISILFNLLTGTTFLEGGDIGHRASVFPNFSHLLVAPINLRSSLLKNIDKLCKIKKLTHMKFVK